MERELIIIMSIAIAFSIFIVITQYVALIGNILFREISKKQVKRYSFPIIGVLIYLYDAYRELD